MDSVRVRICAAEFYAMMTEISEWLDANGYQPIRYRYDHYEDEVLVTVDFPARAAAEAFAMRFDGADRLSRPACRTARAVCQSRTTVRRRR
jgi:hypothetical protein